MSNALTLEDKNRIELEIVNAINENPRLTMRDAARAAGISHTTLYKLMDQNKGFAQRIRQAQAHARQAALDSLEEHLYERSRDPKNPTGCTAAIFLLKGNRPALYGERPVKLATNIAVHIDQAQFDLAQRAAVETENLGEIQAPEDDALQLEADGDTWGPAQ